MALTRGRLSNVTPIQANANANEVTVANNKKVYVKSIAIHDGSGAALRNCLYLMFMLFPTVDLLRMQLECSM